MTIGIGGAPETPGTRTGRTYQMARNIYWLATNVVRLAGIIDATYAYDGSNTGYETELREGCLMAKITASGLWVPAKRTAVTTSATSASIVVDNAAFFKAGDTITIGGDTGLTVSSINYSTNTITLSGSITAVADEAVFASGALAGAGTALAVLGEFVSLRDLESDTNIDRSTGHLLIDAYLDDAQILGDLTTVKALATLPTALRFKDTINP